MCFLNFGVKFVYVNGEINLLEGNKGLVDNDKIIVKDWNLLFFLDLVFSVNVEEIIKDFNFNLDEFR